VSDVKALFAEVVAALGRRGNATYRLQLGASLGFDQVAALAPYLEALGISDAYLSPCFKCGPGSSHGYDVTDHNAFNPELGSAAGFDRMATLHKSLIVAAPPRWRTRTLARAGPLSWISPACSPDGRTVAAAAGPNREDVPFGREARSIWLVRLDGRVRTRLTPPPPRGESRRVENGNAAEAIVEFLAEKRVL